MTDALSCQFIAKMQASWSFVILCCCVFARCNGKPEQKSQNLGLLENSRIPREFELLTWLFGPNAFRSELTNVTNHNQSTYVQERRTNETEEKHTEQENYNRTTFRIGPFIFTDLKDSHLKRANLTPEFGKEIRDEIYRQSQEHSRAVAAVTFKPRRKRDIRPSKFNRDNHAISKRQTYVALALPPGQEGSYHRLKKQPFDGYRVIPIIFVDLTGRTTKSKRPDEDTEEEDSEEFDFDSKEFMSIPVRMGFIPPYALGGFRGR